MVSKIEGVTGTVTVNPETVLNKVGDERFVCPTTHGGKDFPTGAYSPLTTTSLYGIRNNQIAPGTDKIGTVQAINVETGRITWKHERRACRRLRRAAA